MKMNDARWQATGRYIREVFGASDAHLAGLSARAKDAGLPDIAVSPDVGQLLSLLMKATPARCAIELGTLAGYSAIWLARALSDGGRLYTVELDPLHADVAERELTAAGVADRVDVVRGAALDVLDGLGDRLGPASVDFAFIDAVKTEYPGYLEKLRPLIKVGGMLVADNVLGAGEWWIDDDKHPSRQAVDTFNRALASDPDFDAALVPLREGLLIARRHR